MIVNYVIRLKTVILHILLSVVTDAESLIFYLQYYILDINMDQL